MSDTDSNRSYDVIIVGAGTAGVPLAARLSENDARQVLLLEAGPDYVTIDQFPGEIARARSLAAAFPGHPLSWNFIGRLTDERDSYPLARGKIIGGSSSVNGTYFIRGRPAGLRQVGRPEQLRVVVRAGAAVFPQGGERPRLRQRVPRPGRADPGRSTPARPASPRVRGLHPGMPRRRLPGGRGQERPGARGRRPGAPQLRERDPPEHRRLLPRRHPRPEEPDRARRDPRPPRALRGQPRRRRRGRAERADWSPTAAPRSSSARAVSSRRTC